MCDNLQIGMRIKLCREKLNMSQEELGQYVGLNKSTIQRYESGEVKRIKLPIIQALAKPLGVAPEYLSLKTDDPHFQKIIATKIPVLGYVRAGIPIEAVDEILDYEEITPEMARQGEYFGLKIKGDSMEPRLREGDVIIVRKQSSVDNGEVAVVLVNGGDATVKRLYRSEAGIQLVATNPAYEPLFFTPAEVDSKPVTVIGKVVEFRGKTI